ncbi:uncharacterized protein BT62DRAFT_883756 [Guyanagaster necrorhizus]|uniref:Anaphase-promoting complex subunit 2 n=1 Tax=Guyanagaster necrorhizus TaxID=856835 RepID=A0A9P8AXA7_9AGAR|nr:uncharacterized protein BT62DRAFT_883756 [Guyanagaster necrorhizus MCA 3950]KAG7451564.1 hypothetical protein BT62DRAFT_883756 [Guyanagaster necrorhizus MCA 3950]
MATEALRSQVGKKWQDSFARLNHGEPGISGLMTFSQASAWVLLTDFVRPRDLNDPAPPNEYNMELVKYAFDLVSQCRRLPAMLEAYLDDVRQYFYLIKRDVDQYMEQYETSLDPEIISRLVYRLFKWFNAWLPISDLGQTIRAAYTLDFQTQLFAILPPSFVSGFKAYCASTLPPFDPDVTQRTLSGEIWDIFEILGLLDRYESVIASVGYEHIETYVLSTCTGKWEAAMLPELRNWMSHKIVPWMLMMYARGAATNDDAVAMLASVGSRFDFHMTKTLCDLRTREIFDIIIDFPESAPALEDLKECLQRVDQRAALVKSLRKANHKRLLHPGADTKLILSQYVATIKCMRIIDPPGVLLFKVADPIRRYLRDRPDTIRSIVANLVGDEDTGDSLVDDNEPPQPLHQIEIEDYSDPNWEPEPIDAGPNFRANKHTDVLGTLVSIYDSNDLFIKELQILLAQRLLAITDGNTEKVERERRNIEILKIRFGESALQVCEVMLKDMTDSKRIDGHVQSQMASIVHPTIISKHFWPMLGSDEIIMPGQFQTFQEQYAKEFSTFKPDKRLRWLPHLGAVHLELLLEDRTLEVDVPPLEAAFIELFSEKNVWSIDELMTRVGPISKGAALKALLTWVDKGVLKEEGDGSFKLLEVAETVKPVDPAPIVEEQKPTVFPAQQHQAEQMRVYWKFIEGMLTNLTALPLERIQAMLHFAPGYDQTIEQLSAFMDAARREKLVDVREGLWRLTTKA